MVLVMIMDSMIMDAYGQKCPLQDLMQKRLLEKEARIAANDPSYEDVRIQPACVECFKQYEGRGDPACEFYNEYSSKIAKWNTNNNNNNNGSQDMQAVAEGGVEKAVRACAPKVHESIINGGGC